jgi:dihydrofolate reductase
MNEGRPRIALIWAMSRNRIIGRQNALPWRLPADLAHFKALTSGHPVIMGRKTYESLGRPLPNRTNIILTGDRGWSAAGCLVTHSLREAIELGSRNLPAGKTEVFVMGGENVYRQALACADRLYVTLVEAEVEGDATFPEVNWSEWRETSRHEHAQDDKNAYPCTFLSYERLKPAERC